jgi:hypothetical protein
VKSTTDRNSRGRTEGEPFHVLLDDFEQLRTLAYAYVRTYRDGIAAAARTFALRAIFVALLVVFAASAFCTAGVLAIWGLADTLGALTGLSPWTARLLTGLGIIVISAGSAGLLLHRQEHRWLLRRRAEYRTFFDHLH